MLIKERDNHDSDVESLRSLLDSQISSKHRFLGLSLNICNLSTDKRIEDITEV